MNKINLIDVGCGKFLPPAWDKNYKYINNYLGFDIASNPSQKIKKNKKHIFYKKAVSDKEGEVLCYICRKKKNSSLLKPNKAVIKKYMKTNKVNKRFEVNKEKYIECVRLDSVIKKLDINFDFLKTDTEGCDFNVIKSLGEYLDTQIIGIQFEGYFQKMYEEIVLFEEIHKFLIKHNFKKVKIFNKKSKFVSDFLYLKKNKSKKDKMKLIKKIYGLI